MRLKFRTAVSLLSVATFLLGSVQAKALATVYEAMPLATAKPTPEPIALAEPALKMRIRYDVQTLNTTEPLTLAAGSKVLVRHCDDTSCYVWPYQSDPEQSWWDRYNDGARIVTDSTMHKVPLAAVRPKRFHTYKHQATHKPLFTGAEAKGQVTFQQGNVGDCVLLAALAALSLKRPEALKDLVSDEGESCLVRLHRPLADRDDAFTAVTLRTPKSLVSKRGDSPPRASGALYAAIIEKAFIDIIPAYQAKGEPPSYDRLDGVSFRIALSALSGKPAHGVNLATLTTPEQRQKALDLIALRLAGDELVIAATRASAKLLTKDHAFAVLAMEEEQGERYLRVYNPHGEGNGMAALLPEALLGGNRGLSYFRDFWSGRLHAYKTGHASSRIRAQDFLNEFDLVFWTKS